MYHVYTKVIYTCISSLTLNTCEYECSVFLNIHFQNSTPETVANNFGYNLSIVQVS